jgi:thymidylate synthase (FAD)
MKLIKQSYEILPSVNTLKDIELAARTCYSSFDKISEDNSSAVTLVTNLIKRRHYAMLEFSDNLVLVVDQELLDNLWSYAHKPFFKHFNVTKSNSRIVLSMNIRTAVEFMEYIDSLQIMVFSSIRRLCCSIFLYVPPMFFVNIDMKVGFMVHVISGSIACNYHKLGQKLLVSKLERGIHETLTVRFITNRGVSHELVRHRHCSFAQKSTRYCDEKGKIEFIEPCWDYVVDGSNFILPLTYSEIDYKELRKKGWKPEQAREILPNALATELVVKASLQEWKHIFSLRCDKAAHPMMQDLMKPLQKEFNQLYDVV